MKVEKKIKRSRWIALICGIALLANSLLFAQPSPANAAPAVDLGIEAKSAILIEASTGQVLYELNADEPMPPASMAKMMTEYLVMEDIKAGKISWDSIVAPSQYAVDVIGSGQLIGPNEKYTVKELFYAMSIYSANDATVALAEFVGGTEENFVKRMNETAQRFGFNPNSKFVSSTGLPIADLGKYAPPSDLPDSLMTARDAAKLAQRIVLDHPEVLEFSSIPSRKFREKDKSPMINWNWMLEGNMNVPNFRPYAYEGLDGLKTGHTNEAGYCFTGTAERNGMRLISVVMNTASEPKRFLETRKLLDYGFNNFEVKTIVPGKTQVEQMPTAEIKKGVKTTVPVVTANPIDFVVEKGKQPEIELVAAPLEELKSAPIQQGDVLGTLTVKYNGIEQQVDLIASEDVEKGSWFRLMMRGIKNFFVGIFSGIANSLKNLF